MARQFQQITGFLDNDRLVAPLKYMSNTLMGEIEALRINPVALAHPLRKIALQRRIHGHNIYTYLTVECFVLGMVCLYFSATFSERQ